MKRVNIKIVVFTSLGLLIASGWFYWFQLRPINIRKSCVNEARKKYGAISTNNTYRICLVKKGFKPESLLVNID